MKAQPLNFSPLENTAPSQQTLMLKTVQKHAGFYSIAIVIAFMSILLHPGFFILVFISISGQAYFASARIRRTRIAEFGMLNNLHYTPSPNITKYAVYFDHNGPHYVSDGLQGTFNKWPVRVFTYGYQMVDEYFLQMQDKSLISAWSASRFLPTIALKNFIQESFEGHKIKRRDDSYHHVTVLQITLPVTVPHVFIDSRHDRTVFAKKISNERKLTLEGDFNDYFTVYVAKDFEVEALDILSPDFMQYLIELPAKVDIEFLGNSAYVYLESHKGQLYEYMSIFILAENLVANLQDKLDVWRFYPSGRNHTPLRQK